MAEVRRGLAGGREGGPEAHVLRRHVGLVGLRADLVEGAVALRVVPQLHSALDPEVEEPVAAWRVGVLADHEGRGPNVLGRESGQEPADLLPPFLRVVGARVHEGQVVESDRHHALAARAPALAEGRRHGLQPLQAQAEVGAHHGVLLGLDGGGQVRLRSRPFQRRQRPRRGHAHRRFCVADQPSDPQSAIPATDGGQALNRGPLRRRVARHEALVEGPLLLAQRVVEEDVPVEEPGRTTAAV